MASWWPKKAVAPLKNELSDSLDGSGGGNFPTSNKITNNKIRWPFFTWRIQLWKVKSWHFKEQRCHNFKCSFVSKLASDKAQLSGIHLHFLRFFLNKWPAPSKLLIFGRKKNLFHYFCSSVWLDKNRRHCYSEAGLCRRYKSNMLLNLAVQCANTFWLLCDPMDLLLTFYLTS